MFQDRPDGDLEAENESGETLPHGHQSDREQVPHQAAEKLDLLPT